MGTGPSSPWIGLRWYGPADRDYFFGRESDERVIAANIRSRRLTVLYGAPGIGKSSLLLAGVVPSLREKRSVVVFRDWQGPAYLEKLRRQCADMVRGPEELDPAQPLDELLAAVARTTGAPPLVVFDQFEEYFVSHPPSVDGNEFEPEFARAVNRADIDGGFLISLREDALAAMDRFQARIPNLLRNFIRLEYLTTEAAEHVISASLDAWNRQHGAAASIEPSLLRELLPDVQRRAHAPLLGAVGGPEAPENAIEAPFLQLVLQRLWETELEQGSSTLTLATYERLGRAHGIVGAHFDAILEALTEKQRELCARFFDRIVTPSGGKISYPVADLDKLAGDLEPHVESTLATLENARILRTVDLGGREAIEIYHDVLAPTIVSWSAELARERSRAEERRRLLRRAAQVALLALVILAGVCYVAYSNWRTARPWATLSDLGSGRVFQLKGTQVIVGRSVPGQEADVSFPGHSNFVSRLHLIVYRGGSALDVRSTNGTTVNGEFLRYGLGVRQLEPGDIVVVAGAAVLRFEPIRYPFWRVWTPSKRHGQGASGWAMLIAGGDAAPLTTTVRYLSLDHGKVVAGSSRRGALVGVRRTTPEGEYELDDVRDGMETYGHCAKANAEDYLLYRVPDGASLRVPSACVLILGAATRR